MCRLDPQVMMGLSIPASISGHSTHRSRIDPYTGHDVNMQASHPSKPCEMGQPTNLRHSQPTNITHAQSTNLRHSQPKKHIAASLDDRVHVHAHTTTAVNLDAEGATASWRVLHPTSDLSMLSLSLSLSLSPSLPPSLTS